MRDPAGNLARFEGVPFPLVECEDVVFSGKDRIGQEAEEWRRIVSVLAFTLRVIDALAEKPAGSSGFKAPHLEPQFFQAVAQGGNGIAHPAAGLVAQSDVEQPPHERACGHDDRTGLKAHAKIGLHPGRDAILDQQPGDIALLEIEMRLPFQEGLHPKLVGLLVTLCPRGADTWPLACIEHSELDPGGVGIEAHHATQRVDFADHVAFGQSAYGRIARHLTDRVRVLREHQRLTTKPRGRHGRFNAGMARSNDDHVIGFGIVKLAHAMFVSTSRLGAFAAAIALIVPGTEAAVVVPHPRAQT